MWAYASYGSRWVHTDAIIRVPPEINNDFITTLTTTKGDDLITIYLYINGSVQFVSMNERVVRTRSTYHELLRSYSYRQQIDKFHPIVIHCQFTRSIFTKRSGQWWFWYIANARLVIFIEVRRKCITLIFCNCLLFARYFFNLISRSFFNCLARIFLITGFSLVFVVHVYPNIFLITTFFPA